MISDKNSDMVFEDGYLLGKFIASELEVMEEDVGRYLVAGFEALSLLPDYEKASNELATISKELGIGFEADESLVLKIIKFIKSVLGYIKEKASKFTDFVKRIYDAIERYVQNLFDIKDELKEQRDDIQKEIRDAEENIEAINKIANKLKEKHLKRLNKLKGTDNKDVLDKIKDRVFQQDVKTILDLLQKRLENCKSVDCKEINFDDIEAKAKEYGLIDLYDAYQPIMLSAKKMKMLDDFDKATNYMDTYMFKESNVIEHLKQDRFRDMVIDFVLNADIDDTALNLEMILEDKNVEEFIPNYIKKYTSLNKSNIVYLYIKGNRITYYDINTKKLVKEDVNVDTAMCRSYIAKKYKDDKAVEDIIDKLSNTSKVAIKTIHNIVNDLKGYKNPNNTLDVDKLKESKTKVILGQQVLDSTGDIMNIAGKTVIRFISFREDYYSYCIAVANSKIGYDVLKPKKR